MPRCDWRITPESTIPATGAKTHADRVIRAFPELASPAVDWEAERVLALAVGPEEAARRMAVSREEALAQFTSAKVSPGYRINLFVH